MGWCVWKQITSRFDGVIKKIYHEADDMAQVGKVFLPLLLFLFRRNGQKKI